MTHKALYINEDCPKHLQLEFHTSCSYNLRPSAAPLLYVPTTDFKFMAARSIDSLFLRKGHKEIFISKGQQCLNY